MNHAFRAAVCVLSFGVGQTAAADDQDGRDSQAKGKDPLIWQQVLAQPLSPGSVMLLVTHAQEPGVRERWLTALTAEQPDIRIAAARAASASGSLGLVPQLLEALSREKHGVAAGEEARALAELGGAGAVTRAGSMAIRSGDPQLLEVVLVAARNADLSLDPGILAAAVGMPNEDFGAVAAWHLALSLGHGTSLPEQIQAAVQTKPQASAPTDFSTAFAFELLKRMAGGPAVENSAWITGLGTNETLDLPPDIATRRSLLSWLTAGELAALSRRLTGDPARLARESERPPARSSMHTIRDLPSGALRELVAASGCQPPKADGWAGAQVVHESASSTRTIAFLESGLSPGCSEVARAALLLSLTAQRNAASHPESELVLVNITPGSLACLDEEVRENAGPHYPRPSMSGRGKIEEPKKTRDVPPRYPLVAAQRRIQGAVVLEAIVSPSGCVQSVEVKEGIDTSLDAAALRAVSRWRYTPTLLNGVPVPVIMTVTVHFKLS